MRQVQSRRLFLLTGAKTSYSGISAIAVNLVLGSSALFPLPFLLHFFFLLFLFFFYSAIYCALLSCAQF